MKTKIALLTLAILFAGTRLQAGTFANITIDGDFSDWASVPVALTDANESFSKDLNQIFLANDATNLYIRITFNQATNPNDGGGLYLAFDNDSNAATGYDVYGLGLVGSEAAY